jgi:hypothetical protein
MGHPNQMSATDTRKSFTYFPVTACKVTADTHTELSQNMKNKNNSKIKLVIIV